MKWKPKHERIIKHVEWFIPDNCDGMKPMFGPDNLDKEFPLGVRAEIAYLKFTSTGMECMFIRNVPRYNQLMIAHQRMALQVSEWKKGIEDGLLFIEELEDWQADLVKGNKFRRSDKS